MFGEPSSFDRLNLRKYFCYITENSPLADKLATQADQCSLAYHSAREMRETSLQDKKFPALREANMYCLSIGVSWLHSSCYFHANVECWSLLMPMLQCSTYWKLH